MWNNQRLKTGTKNVIIKKKTCKIDAMLKSYIATCSLLG